MATLIIDDVPDIKRIKCSDIVLVRTYSAGVHFGYLKHRKGKEVILTNARRLYLWSGALSLSEVAVNGVELKNSKITVNVPEILLTEAIEIIKMTEKAAKQMMEAKPWKI